MQTFFPSAGGFAEVMAEPFQPLDAVVHCGTLLGAGEPSGRMNYES
jgi:hypothetical protein